MLRKYSSEDRADRLHAAIRVVLSAGLRILRVTHWEVSEELGEDGAVVTTIITRDAAAVPAVLEPEPCREESVSLESPGARLCRAPDRGAIRVELQEVAA